MEQYINKELKDCISSMQFKKGKTKEGNEYTYLNIILINGYNHRIYLRDAEQFAFFNAIDSHMTTKQMSLDSTESF